jgi:hypothetical protein
MTLKIPSWMWRRLIWEKRNKFMEKLRRGERVHHKHGYYLSVGLQGVTFQTQLRNKDNQLDTLFTFTYILLRLKVSTCFGHYLPIFRRHYTDAALVTIVCGCRCGLVSGLTVFPHPETNPHLQPHTIITKPAFVYCLLKMGK